MKFHHELKYNAEAADVYAMLADPEFRRLSAEAMGVISADVSITPTADGMSVTIDQIQRTEGIPSFAKTFAGDTTRAVQREEWTSPTEATITIETPGKPTKIAGTLRLTHAGGVTTETMEADVKVRVPLIGGKLETLMSDLIAKGMDKEHIAGSAWLAGAGK